ncbi:atypical membrane-integrating protein (Mistic protein) [Bacillus kexueae]|uniref:atypical membrane-integrating protein (Mistic protein) n=1 Tax=Aeribacillus kexueae TaxID=2078952 RepID=UPI001FB02708|nr:atypical membrane-integrating protein (Mistic protein) [Bacillus kexueae]
MKISPDEKLQLSDSIDKMNEALDTFIQFYNEAEEEKPLIEFDSSTFDMIEQAIEEFGKEVVERKINTIIQEIFSFVRKK